MEEQEPDATGELPELAIESFDEGHPVSIPVDPSATAHFRPVSVESIAASSARPEPVGSGSASVDASVQQAIERAVGPGGPLAQSLEKAVAEAVASALKQVLPAVAAEAARLVREDDEG